MSMTTADQNKVIYEYHKTMTDYVSQSFSNMLDRADDVLFKLSTCGDAASKDHASYLNAMRKIRLSRHSIENQFKRNLQKNLSNSMSDKLISDNDDPAALNVEEKAALVNSIRRANTKCSTAMYNLDQKMQTLLDKEASSDKSKPVAPCDLFKIFTKVNKELDINMDIKVILYKLFEKHVVLNLDKVYSNVSEHMDVLPDLFWLTENTNEPVKYKPKNTQNITELKNFRKSKSTVFNLPEKSEPGKVSSLKNQDHDKNYFMKTTCIIRNEIENRIHGCEIPQFMRIFLFESWSKLLMKIHMKEGANSDAWHQSLSVIDDMVAGIENPEEFEKSKKLYSLKEQLLNGMNIIPLSETISEDFINEFTNYFLGSIRREILKKENLDDLGRYNLPVNDAGYSYQLDNSEDVTIPNYISNTNAQPFMDELLVDSKK